MFKKGRTGGTKIASEKDKRKELVEKFRGGKVVELI